MKLTQDKASFQQQLKAMKLENSKVEQPFIKKHYADEIIPKKDRN